MVEPDPACEGLYMPAAGRPGVSRRPEMPAPGLLHGSVLHVARRSLFCAGWAELPWPFCGSPPMPELVRAPLRPGAPGATAACGDDVFSGVLTPSPTFHTMLRRNVPERVETET